MRNSFLSRPEYYCHKGWDVFWNYVYCASRLIPYSCPSIVHRTFPDNVNTGRLCCSSGVPGFHSSCWGCRCQQTISIPTGRSLTSIGLLLPGAKHVRSCHTCYSEQIDAGASHSKCSSSSTSILSLR
ncbi:unnamed protein product [Somion occarium]|uniref:Uncharacterized protein n=1 Tax=Somion occarium TaxID=3059160 RepID=A0ABP1CT80_9APHY